MAKKKLLNLFDDLLETIFNNNNNEINNKKIKSFGEKIGLFKKEIIQMRIGMRDYPGNKFFDEQLSEEVFSHAFVALADKLINTTNKEENQIIINDIQENGDKLYEQDDSNNFVIQPGYKSGDLIDAAKIIIEFNEALSLNDDDND